MRLPEHAGKKIYCRRTPRGPKEALDEESVGRSSEIPGKRDSHVTRSLGHRKHEHKYLGIHNGGSWLIM